MTRLSLAFFTTGALCVMVGMVWGAIMGSSEDFTLAPAHAHLNLVGWASLALMGSFYALSGKGGRVGWANYAFSTVGVLIMIPSMTLYIGGNKALLPGVVVGSTLAMLGMATFLFVVLSSWRDARSANA